MQIGSHGNSEEGPVLPKMEEDETKREISWRRLHLIWVLKPSYPPTPQLSLGHMWLLDSRHSLDPGLRLTHWFIGRRNLHCEWMLDQGLPFFLWVVQCVEGTAFCFLEGSQPENEADTRKEYSWKNHRDAEHSSWWLQTWGQTMLEFHLSSGLTVWRNWYSLDYLSQFTLNGLVQTEIILIERCYDLNIRNWPRDRDGGGSLEEEKG